MLSSLLTENLDVHLANNCSTQKRFKGNIFIQLQQGKDLWRITNQLFSKSTFLTRQLDKRTHNKYNKTFY